jgi:hypothetical protein
MNVSRKVLHLSLLLAMSLPIATTWAASDDSLPLADGNESTSGAQIAAGKGNAQQFKNAGEADKLRHRVNQVDKENADRTRLEQHDQDADSLKQQDRLRDRDQLKDQDKIQDQLRQQDRLKDADPTKTQQQSGIQLKQQSQNRYLFEKRSAGQGFGSGGSMFQSMGSSSSMGGGHSSAQRSSGGGGRR